jgi:hypothetical protein
MLELKIFLEFGTWDLVLSGGMSLFDTSKKAKKSVASMKFPA